MGKNVLIVGASGDIGYAIADRLLADGYSVILHYNENIDVFKKLKLKYSTEKILSIIQADLCSDEYIKLFIKQLIYPVDSIVFASGTAYYGLFQDMDEMTMDNMLTLHVKAPWMITKHLLPAMIQRKAGNVVFITSIWGDIGASYEVVYSAVKGAQNSFVKALAKEVAPSGISVNAISPGFIDTKMNEHLSQLDKDAIIEDIPINRAGLPSDIANTVSFLIDEKSNYIQGEVIRMNGAW